MNAKEEGKAWGVWIRVDDGRRRGFNGANSSNGRGKPSEKNGMGNDAADHYQNKMYMGSYRFSKNPSQQSCYNQGSRSGESSSFHNGIARGLNEKGKDTLDDLDGQVAVI